MKKKLADEIGKAYVRLHCSHSEDKGDLISRQAVLDVWHTSYSDIREENEEIQYKKIAFELPSADVRPNIHGHWEEDSKEGFHHCSKCGQIIFSCQKWFKCCPKCMAVMDEKPFKNCHKTKCEACIYHGHCDREDMREPIGEKGTE